MPALRRIGAAAVTAALVTTLGAAFASPASAAAPVTVDDHITMYAGGARAVDVLKNDSDPDGDDLAVCRVADAGDHGDYFVDIVDGQLVVLTSPEATGDIVVTYYACDFETLVPATLTISVKEIQPITVEKLARPGLLRVTNDNDRRVAFLYGSFKEDHADGRVGVPPGDSVVIRVHRHTIDWIAVLGRTILADMGHVRHIELPQADQILSPRVILSHGERRLWTAQG